MKEQQDVTQAIRKRRGRGLSTPYCTVSVMTLPCAGPRAAVAFTVICDVLGGVADVTVTNADSAEVGVVEGPGAMSPTNTVTRSQSVIMTKHVCDQEYRRHRQGNVHHPRGDVPA